MHLARFTLASALMVLPLAEPVGQSLRAYDTRSKDQSKVPHTPAGRQFAAWLDVFNQADRWQPDWVRSPRCPIQPELNGRSHPLI
jgi:hypothetical protein